MTISRSFASAALVASIVTFAASAQPVAGVVRVTMANQPTNDVKIEVVQWSAAPRGNNEAFSPIELERTRVTGLKHLDGTVSMARSGPNSATSDVFICIGDQPELNISRVKSSKKFCPPTQYEPLPKIQSGPVEGGALG